jgi:ATP-dependent DNA ligase
MRKFKLWRTIDCVVGGLYRNPETGLVDSLLLGLYGDDGLLHYVGRTRITAGARKMGELLKPLIGGTGFTGACPVAKVDGRAGSASSYRSSPSWLQR